jgi:hypothetical protein
VIVLILLGFFRDAFLSQYNNYLYQLYYHDPDYVIKSSYSFLKNFSYYQLYYAKVFIIAFFCILYYLISIVTIKKLFKDKKYQVICSYFYLCILGISLIFYLYGLISGGNEKMFELSRTFLAMLQSPLVLMILIPAFKISLQKTNTD